MRKKQNIYKEDRGGEGLLGDMDEKVSDSDYIALDDQPSGDRSRGFAS